VKVTVPQLGDKKQILDCPSRNFYRIEQLKFAIVDPTSSYKTNYGTNAKDLRLPELVIECFDNSNIQGTNPVSACVVFKDGKKASKRITVILI
jgi:excinuclease ABC subunit C